MRKRSKYRPRPQLQDPVNWVLNGFLPISITSPIMTCRIKNHAAIVAAEKGHAGWEDIDALIGAFNMAEALAHLDIGAEYKVEIRAALDAVKALGSRPRMLYKGTEMRDVQLGMEIHDAQIDDSRTTVAVMEEALRIVKQVIRLNKARKLEPACN